MIKSHSVIKILFPLCIISILVAGQFNTTIYQMRSFLAVISGICLTLLFDNPYQEYTKKIVSKLLTWSIVGLGFGINLLTVVKAGMDGIGYTFVSIIFCLIIGLSLGFLLRNKRDTSVLITCGTAICGGSAIAAIAPTIKAEAHEISVSLAIIFILNAIALFIFPIIGHYLGLSETQFGLWSALAIHDTSSVVGATLPYGQKALEVGTTVKLARALWIIPLTFSIGWVYAKYIFKTAEEEHQSFKKPWFILGFLLAAAIVTWIPKLQPLGLYIRNFAELGLIVALFCIGTNLSRTALYSVGMQPFIQGVILWIIMASATLYFVI